MNMQQSIANNYMVLDISIGRADPMKHSAVASDAAASECRVDGAVPVRTRVGALGRLTTDLKQVNSKFASVRTWLYDNTLPFTDCEEGQQKRGKRIVPVSRVPEVLAKLAELKGEAFAALDAFMPDYRQYYSAHNRADLGRVSDVDMPDPDVLADKYRVNVGAPEPLPVFNVDTLALPAGLAADIAQRHHDRLSKQLDGAKQAAIEGAQKHMDVVEKQLTDGKRLHQSLLDNAKRHARLLRDMVEGYDNDPRVLAIADLIDERIASIPNIEQVKNSATRRNAVIRAASTASKSLAEVANSESTATPAAPAASNVITGDSLLADLID
jgi:hypothetical protein